jgi:hypothetical protein
VVLYFLINFAPIFLVITGYVAKAFFFFKIKWLWYRLALIPTIILSTWQLILILHDLEHVLYVGATLDPNRLKAGAWEKYNVFKLIDEIKFDCLFYYLYRHRKIINNEITLDLQGFYMLSKEPKSLGYVLVFLLFFLLIVMVFIESWFRTDSLLIDLVKEIKRQ